MNPLFKQLYKHKRTRTRDPNAPPPPNLFSTVRDLKDTKSIVDVHTAELQNLKDKIARLEKRNRFLETSVDMLRSRLNRK